MIPAERRRVILELIREERTVAVAELCERFDVSDMTIRRDLRELDREGLLRRVHGGAVSRLGRSYEPPYHWRAAQNLEAKRAIGQAAAELIYDGNSIGLDVGTTTLEVVHALRELHESLQLTIVTASLPIANEIIANFPLESEVRLILTGGVVRAGELSMVGQFAEKMYRQLHVDKVFIGVGGVHLEEGLTEYNLEDAHTKPSLIRSARERIVLADSSKLGKTTFASVAPLSIVDVLITDWNAPTQMVEDLRKIGIRVIVAEKLETQS